MPALLSVRVTQLWPSLTREHDRECYSPETAATGLMCRGWDGLKVTVHSILLRMT